MSQAADLLLGIDLGTTALKAGVFDAQSGEALSNAVERLPVEAAADGQREQQPSELLAALRRVVRRFQDELGSAWQGVAGIGLASQGGSAILCDRQSGAAFTPMQLWNDTRPLPLLGEIASRRPEGYWRQLSRLPGPGAGLARIAWLRQRYPQLVPDSETARPATLYAGAGEYIYFALTGCWRQDAGNALQIGCYSTVERALVADPLAAVGVPLAFVAALRGGHETHPLSEQGSRLLDLPAGIPVVGPYIDHEAGYLSAVCIHEQPDELPDPLQEIASGKERPRNDSFFGVERPRNDKFAGVDPETEMPPTSKSRLPRPLQCSLGTAWVGNFVAGADYPPGGGIDLVLPSPVNSEALTATDSLILRVMAAGNLTWDWGLDTLLSGPRPAALEQAEAIFAESLLPPDGLVSFPWFTRPNAWNARLPGNGGFLGLSAQTGPADLLRALAAGMTFEFASLFAGLLDGSEAAPGVADAALHPLVNCVILGGGASKGTGFQRLLAALFAPLPVFVALDQEMVGARGCVYAFSGRAAGCSVRGIPPPSPSTCAHIAQQYQHYLTVRQAICPGNEDTR